MEQIKPGLQIFIEQLKEVPNTELVIKSNADTIELVYFLNASECQISKELDSSYLVNINLEAQYFTTNDLEFPFQNIPRHTQSVCCNTQFILLDMISTKLTGIYRKMFLESKAVELVLKAYSLHKNLTMSCDSCRFLKMDYNKEKIQQARQILLDQLNNPPTIQELAKILCINQCYLKKGFKEIYNSTIYDFVQEQRMALAKGMMRNARNINEISESLGFSSISSFSKAFKKMHGVNPSEMKQTEI